MSEFQNREEAGRMLANRLERFAGPDTVVYALPRGGVPVAAPIAKALGAPLSLLFVQKIGAPAHLEVAIGAIVDGDNPTQVRQHEVIDALNVSELYISAKSEAAVSEIERRKALYCGLYSRIPLKGKTAIIVDDGLATGASMEAAIKAAQKCEAKRVIAAVPVGPRDTVSRLGELADEIICMDTPSPYWSVSKSYDEFPQLDDADVMEILNEASPDGGEDGERPCLVRRRA
jgi:putative phosphoribosyl transferase